MSSTILTFLIVGFSFRIILIDCRFHLIHNKDLLLFAPILALSLKPISLIAATALILFVLALSFLCRIGGGDFKLFALLTLTQGQLVASSRYLILLALCLALSSLVSLLATRAMEQSVPLAPAILAPFLITYLAI